MPSVPRLEIPTGANIAGPSGVFQSSDRAATPDAFGAQIGQAQQRLGGAIEHSADVMQKHANLLADRANQAAATDMFVEWDKEASAVTSWYKSQSGKNAVDQLPEYYKRLDEVRQKYVNSSPNIEVRRMFDQDSKRRVGFMISDGGAYAGNQNKQYNLSQARARQDLSIQQAGNAKDDAEFNNALTDARIGAANEAEELGLPPDQKKLHLDNAVSKAWGTRLQTIALSDPFRAKELYEKNKNSVTDPAVRMHIERNIEQQYNSVGSRLDAHAIENGTPFKAFPSIGGSTNREAIGKIESGGRYDAIGPETAKGQRAYGKYQVMDFNIGPWTKEVLEKEMTPQEFLKDKEAQDAVFDKKFGQLTEKYGNSQDAASAWFSGRPLAAAAGAKDITGTSAQEYVNRFNKALGGEGAEPLTPQSGPEWLAKATARAKEIASARAPDNPNYEDLLVGRVKTAYNNVRTVMNQVYRENYNVVKGATLEQDESGKPKLTDISQILDNPQLNQAYNQLDKAHQNAIIGQVQKNAKADVPVTTQNYARFQGLQGLAVDNPQKFLDVDILQEDMPRTLQGQLLTKQRALEKSKQDTTGLTRAVSTVTPMLNDAGIRRSATDQGVASRYNQFIGAFQTERDQWIKDHGGKTPSDKENQTIAAGVLRVSQESSYIPWRSEQRQFEVPDTNKEEISKAFSTRYGRPPTPAETYQVYQRQLNRESNAGK
jgi:hypothetical protein